MPPGSGLEGADAQRPPPPGPGSQPAGDELSPAGSRLRAPWLRLAAVVVTVVVAYHYTLSTLVGALALDTPLAYLGLVPVLALGMALVLLRRPTYDHEIHDRQVDLLVGLPLVGTALLGALVLPHRLGSEFWLWRLDVLTLPLFAAGMVALLLGTRVLWRLRAPLALLLLAWPLPWTSVLERLDQPLLSWTTAAVRGLVGLVPVAQPYGEATGDAVFEVPTSTGSFVVTVASACAGASSTLGFLLLGSAAMLLARGPRRRKIAWLVTGVLVAWASNVMRILLLLAVGHFAGEDVAIGSVHPYLGTAVFAVTAVVMVLALPLFGLALHPPVGLRARPAGPVGLAASGRAARVLTALALLVATAVAAGANGDLASNNVIASPFGQARIQALSAARTTVSGWHIGDAGDYPQNARFFGDGATWHRLLYHSTQVLPGTNLPGLPVSVDVVGTGSRRALGAFSVESCYSFHRFEVSAHRDVHLVPGLSGELFTYYNRRDHHSWTTLSWEWPVLQGATSRYERVVLILVDTPGVPVPDVGGRPQPSTAAAPTPRRLAAERAFLEAFAQRLVAGTLRTGSSAGASA